MKKNSHQTLQPWHDIVTLDNNEERVDTKATFYSKENIQEQQNLQCQQKERNEFFTLLYQKK